MYIITKKGNRDNIGPLKVNDALVEEDKFIAKNLNEFFSSVFMAEDLTNIPSL